MPRPTKSEIDAEIIDRAAGLFARYGFENTSLQQIADAVNLVCFQPYWSVNAQAASAQRRGRLGVQCAARHHLSPHRMEFAA
jgi:hypothetical protein